MSIPEIILVAAMSGLSYWMGRRAERREWYLGMAQYCLVMAKYLKELPETHTVSADYLRGALELSQVNRQFLKDHLDA